MMSELEKEIVHQWSVENIDAEVVPGDEGNGDALLYNCLAKLYDGEDYPHYEYNSVQDHQLREWRRQVGVVDGGGDE